ncbi:FUSC family protein, partial [Staphylococcus epidermidis]
MNDKWYRDIIGGGTIKTPFPTFFTSLFSIFLNLTPIFPILTPILTIQPTPKPSLKKPYKSFP